MALEAVVFQQDPFSYGFKDLHTFGGTAPWSCGFGFEEVANYNPVFPQSGGGFGNFINVNSDSSFSSMMQQHSMTNTSSTGDFDGFFGGDFPDPVKAPAANSSSGRRKRRRTKTTKNKEEVENQRMTHIAVERNRRKQMNDYLAVLRSLMPPSYIQRGDQASIVGGAINYVKELEQLLQSLEVQKQIQQPEANFCSPFSGFFTFPQYSTCSTLLQSNSRDQSMAESLQSAIADVEVTMVETHANLKILSKRQPKQLLKMVTGLHSLGLNVLHVNVTTSDQMILYSFSVKTEEDCQLTSVHEIAAAAYEMLGRIQVEAALI